MNIRNYIAKGLVKAGHWVKSIGSGTIGAGNVIIITDKDSDSFNQLWNSGHMSDTQLIDAFYSIPEIFAPVNEIASRVAGANYVLRRVKDDGIIYTNRDMNRILSAPNPLQTFADLIYEAEVYEVVTGKNFMHINIPDTLTFDYKNVTSIINLWADQVEIITPVRIKLFSATKMSDIIKEYRLADNSGPLSFKPEKVLYTKFQSVDHTGRGITPVPPLRVNEKPIRNLKAVYSARYKIYNEQGHIGVYSAEPGKDAVGTLPTDEGKINKLEKDLDNNYGLTGKKRPFAITSESIKFIRTVMSIQELQPFVETDASAKAIYANLRVPKELMPSSEGSTYENQIQAIRTFYQDVIIPRAKRRAQAITSFLQLGEFGYYLDATFDHVEALQENKKQKSEVDWRNNQTWLQQFQTGLITLNEWIATAGLTKVDNPLYDKRTLEMTDEELERIKRVINMKSPVKNEGNEQQSGQGQTES